MVHSAHLHDDNVEADGFLREMEADRSLLEHLRPEGN